MKIFALLAGGVACVAAPLQAQLSLEAFDFPGIADAAVTDTGRILFPNRDHVIVVESDGAIHEFHSGLITGLPIGPSPITYTTITNPVDVVVFEDLQPALFDGGVVVLEDGATGDSLHPGIAFSPPALTFFRFHVYDFGFNETPRFLREVDLDVDGDPDAGTFAESAGGVDMYWVENPALLTTDPYFLPLGFEPAISGSVRGADVLDVDGDGDEDVVWVAASGDVHVRVSDGLGGLLPAADLPAGNALDENFGLTAGNLDSDPELELVVVRRLLSVPGITGTTVSLLDRAGPAWSVTEVIAAFTDPAGTVALGDVDGDSDVDIVLSTDDAVSPSLVFLFQDGVTGLFSSSMRQEVPVSDTIVDLSLLDDGHADVRGREHLRGGPKT